MCVNAQLVLKINDRKFANKYNGNLRIQLLSDQTSYN